MFGRKSGQRSRRPVRTAIIAVVKFVGGFAGGLAIPLAYIWLAGYDCEAPDDSDLAVQEEVDWGLEQEKEFAALTNVLVHIENLNDGYDDTKPEAKRWDRDYSFLTYYVDPVENDYAWGSLTEHYDHQTLLKMFADPALMRQETTRILTSNEWLMATLDRVAESDAFRFPLIEIYQDMDPPMGGLCRLYWSFFPARIKVAAENGEFEKMLRFMDRDLRVSEHYLLRGRSFVDYLVGIAICKNTICGLRDLVQRNVIPESILRRIDERVRSIKGLDVDALFRTYGNEYAYLTHCGMAEWRKIIRRSFGRLSCLFERVFCQPNRTKTYLCAQIRNEMESFRTGHCVKPDDNRTSPWYLMFIDREWLGKDMMSPMRGRSHCIHETVAVGLALRAQIACKRYEMKYGHRPADIVELAPEFLPEVPQSPCDGKTVTLDLAADKIHIGGCEVEELRIGEPKEKVLPFACRNGCYFSADGKSLMGVSDGTKELLIAGANVSIDGVGEGIESIVFLPSDSYGNWSHRWEDDLFEDQTNLQRVVIAPDHPRYGCNGDVIYDKIKGSLVRVLSGRTSVTIPKEVKKISWHAEKYGFGHEGIISSIHFQGALPQAGEYDPLWEAVGAWWERPTMYRFKRIFRQRRCARPFAFPGLDRDCVIYVNREMADLRTRYYVWRGEWAGRKIMWEPDGK